VLRVTRNIECGRCGRRIASREKKLKQNTSDVLNERGFLVKNVCKFAGGA